MATHLSRSPSSWSSQCETQDWDSGVSQAPRLAKLEMSMIVTAMVMMIMKIIIIIIVRSETLVYAECWKSHCHPWSGFLHYFFFTTSFGGTFDPLNHFRAFWWTLAFATWLGSKKGQSNKIAFESKFDADAQWLTPELCRGWPSLGRPCSSSGRRRRRTPPRTPRKVKRLEVILDLRYLNYLGEEKIRFKGCQC